MVCPKGSLLSVRTSELFTRLGSACNVFSSESIKGLNLALCLLFEYLLGPNSRFWGYLQSLPDAVNLPYFWSEGDERRHALAGTEAERLLQRAKGMETEISANVLKEFLQNQGMSLISRALTWSDAANSSHDAPRCFKLRELHRYKGECRSNLTQVLHLTFQNAFSLVSSRAFVVDLYHGMSMCPVADIFDHAEDHHAHFESEDAVCQHCGRLAARGCKHALEPLLSASLPPQQPSLPSEYLPLQLYDDPVVIRAVRPIGAGEHVFNTYGRLSNAELLLRYGFALDIATEFDRSTWNPQQDAEMLQLGAAFECEEIGALHRALTIACNVPVTSAEAACDTLFHEIIESDSGSTAVVAIDAEGRASIQLWRLALVLASGKAQDVDEFFFHHAAISLLRNATDTSVNADDIGDFGVGNSAHRASMRLCTLFRRRIEGLQVRNAIEEEAAFDMMEKSSDATLVAVLRHAQQEYYALKTAYERFNHSNFYN
ncbi:SET domain-containing protein [Tilletiaria anomala UBC 951]|uniref:SET domain-containing protein n=1 Tax=Tilletiaria anomala (strain ATCC 24038 / CBS 436.72 / UBC 951) TaxID=1037660 RepID=A0A066VDD4_TILAU|nr:SET domain-containing protein [Tilletiaria anomala UBC 951]KDN39461.1 SET domain-containing protein [Tilletiaria anomala UBC 951]